MFALLAAISVGAAAAGMGMAGFVYTRPREIWEKFQSGFGSLWEAWQAAYRVDDLYGATIVTPGRKLSEWSAFSFDAGGIDGLVNGIGRVVRAAGARTRVLQTGLVRNYGVGFVAGLLAVVIWLVVAGGGI